MSVGTTAAITAAAIAAGGSVASAAIGSHAANSAADKIAAGQKTAAQNITDVVAPAVQSGKDTIASSNTDLTKAGEDISSLYDPFTKGAGDDVQQLQDLTGPNGPLSQTFSFDQKDFENTPAYKVILDRGQQAIQRSAAATGGLFGTNTLKRLSDYTVDTTNTQIGDAFSRALQTFQANRAAVGQRADTLKSLASLALSGTQGKAGTQGQIASTINSNNLKSADLGLEGAQIIGGANANASANAANAQAAGQVGSTNSWLSALKQGTTAISDYLAKKNFSGNTTPNIDMGDYGFGVGAGHP